MIKKKIRFLKLFFWLLFFVTFEQKPLDAHIRALQACLPATKAACKKTVRKKLVPHDNRAQYVETVVPKTLTGEWQPVLAKFFFSPKDHVQEKLIELIDAETMSIKAAIYLITDIKIVQALIKAKERKIGVELVVDAWQSRSKLSKTNELEKKGIPVFKYDVGNELYNLMHNKFAIFEGQDIVLTGSYNWTQSGDKRNRENIAIFESSEVAAQYRAEYEDIKQLCVH